MTANKRPVFDISEKGLSDIAEVYDRHMQVVEKRISAEADAREGRIHVRIIGLRERPPLVGWARKNWKLIVTFLGLAGVLKYQEIATMIGGITR